MSLVPQLEAAQAAVAAANLAAAAAAAAAPPDPQQHRRSCTSIAELDDPDLSTDGDNNSSSSPQRPQQQQQHAEQQPIKSMSLADSLSAAFSNATNGFNLSGSKGDSAEHEQQQQAPRQQTPSPMSPFGLARKFVADREADAVARLKVGSTVGHGCVLVVLVLGVVVLVTRRRGVAYPRHVMQCLICGRLCFWAACA